MSSAKPGLSTGLQHLRFHPTAPASTAVPVCMCDLDDLSKWARDAVRLHRRAKALGWDAVADAFLAAAGEAIAARTELLRTHRCPEWSSR